MFKTSSRPVTLVRVGLAGLLAAGTLVLAGCSETDETASPETTSAVETAPGTGIETEVAGQDMSNMNARQIIDMLDQLPVDERPADLMASIRPNELLITDADQQETSLPMPEDEFYLSFSPYVSQTHDCYYHSLTTCTGELSNTPVGVQVVDNTTGETIVDKEMTTFDNGFLGIWLPRGLTDATLTVTGEAGTASADISTAGPEDATCLTTLQLS